ncbi:cyclic pyranopterin phosphate synthase [Endobacter medicaginis]|uniref:GTP 3',8-cyclase n=2 Tax=Endobacter medicaginis TaxID=1181271 RepID=A0A839UYX3_9PROT|nr:GTP 3',8-cyclase MoaA [Endobacter medicaginis]MBB3175087.1 cyclic pyranopterin phosphate synthase [Endobacter medicaginis]MCX5476205.1 GTP 3',8-cyclase MoaA [Endobacter medicaginis]
MTAPLIDGFGRRITYLRLSVTDRCDMRCTYCMSETMRFLPRDEVLDLEELARLGEVFIAGGVRRLRITGGEPLVRRDILGLFERLGRRIGDGLDELTLTTNGSRLAEFAEPLAASGVRRVNVSLDSLDGARFAAITRRGSLHRTLDGISAARAAGLAVRINTVALRGINDDEIDTLIGWCGGIGADLCLIETMPLGETGEDRSAHYLPLGELRARLERSWTLSEDGGACGGGPARYLRIAETGRRLGLITPMSHNFCASCNRVRISCTGRLYLCLGHEEGTDLRAALRSGADDAGLRALVDDALDRKPWRHDFAIGPALPPTLSRHMSLTGG